MKIYSQESAWSGAASMAIAALFVKIVGVAFKIPLSYILGDEGMGYFNSAYTVYGFFYIICCSGLPKAITISIAKLTPQTEPEALRRICKRLLLIFACLGAIITSVFMLLSGKFSSLIGSSKSAYTMLAIGPTIIFVSISGILRGFLNGLSSFIPISISQLIESLSKLVLGLAFARLGASLRLPIYTVSALSILGITLGSIFSCIYLYIVVFAGKRNKNAGQSYNMLPIKPVLKSVIVLAVPLTISASIMSLSGMLDLAIVLRGLKSSGYAEADATATYGNYSTLVTPMLNLATSLLAPIAVALLPRLVELWQNGKHAEFSRSVSAACLTTAAIATPISLIYYLYAFDTLDIIFPTTAAVTASAALSSIAPAVILLPMLTLINTALEARGCLGFSIFSMLSGLALKVILSAILIPNPKFGIIGASISSVISYAFSLFLSVILLNARGKVRVAVGQSIFVFLIGALSFIPVFLLIYTHGALGSGSINLVVNILASLIIYIPLAFSFLLLPLFKKQHHNAQKKRDALTS